MKLSDLEEYFSSIELPKTLQLDPCTFLNDVRKCVDSNISYLQNHPKNGCYMPYYDQPIQIKERIEK